MRVSQCASEALGEAGKAEPHLSAAARKRRRLRLEEDQPFLSCSQNPTQSELILITEASAGRRPGERRGEQDLWVAAAGVGVGCRLVELSVVPKDLESWCQGQGLLGVSSQNSAGSCVTRTRKWSPGLQGGIRVERVRLHALQRGEFSTLFTHNLSSRAAPPPGRAGPFCGPESLSNTVWMRPKARLARPDRGPKDSLSWGNPQT